MNLRTSFTFSLVFVVWVAACVFALATIEKRPCIVVPPGEGTGNCIEESCQQLFDQPEYYKRRIAKTYRKCGSTEYFLNCEQQDPSEFICAVEYRYANPVDCNNKTNGSVLHSYTSGEPSCKKYSWQLEESIESN